MVCLPIWKHFGGIVKTQSKHYSYYYTAGDYTTGSYTAGSDTAGYYTAGYYTTEDYTAGS